MKYFFKIDNIEKFSSQGVPVHCKEKFSCIGEKNVQPVKTVAPSQISNGAFLTPLVIRTFQDILR